MMCPFCSSTSLKVTDKRDLNDGLITRRRRECLKCQNRFTTYEKPFFEEITVIKKDGRKEVFDKDKLIKGIGRACEKRPINLKEIEKLVRDVENDINENIASKEIQSSEIGNMVAGKLKNLDEVAFIRFASVYKSFQSASEFVEEVQNLIQIT